MSEVRDPVSDDEPPFYPIEDPDAPADHPPESDGTAGVGEQFPDAGDDD